MKFVILSKEENQIKKSLRLFYPNKVIHSFTDIKKLELKIEKTKDSSQLFLITDLNNESIIDLLSKLITSGHLLKGMILLTQHLSFKNKCEAVRIKYAELGVPFFFLDIPFKAKIIEHLIQLTESLARYLKSNGPFPTKTKWRYLYSQDPGKIIQAARENIGLDREVVARCIEERMPGLTSHRLKEIELDHSGNKVTATEWYLLCELLEIFSDSISSGFEPTLHIRRCLCALERGEFNFPLTETFQKKIQDLENVEAEEKTWAENIPELINYFKR